MKYTLLVKQFTKVWKDGIMNPGTLHLDVNRRILLQGISRVLITLRYNSGFTSTAFCNVLSPVTERYIWEGMGELMKICKKNK